MNDLSSVSQSHLDINSIRSGGEAIGDDLATPPPLFGRDSEKLVLVEAYQRVLQTQEPHVVFVHGNSGQGKTALVDTIRKPVVDSRGYFCAGKFFQDSELQEPFSAITSAFSDLCDLLVQSPDFDEQSRDRIRKSLALDGHLLSQSVNLTPLLSRDSMDQYSIERCEVATFARFQAACKAFLSAIALREHPVVLFIDDLQWLDSGSAKLIEAFIIDSDMENVMFIFSYRDEEASVVEDIVQSANMKRRVTDIQLFNLGLSGVRQILGWKLESTTENIEQLSELTFQRTGGNPFFVSLFVEAIATDDFVSLNEGRLVFDVDQIRSSIMVANDIADLLSHKVRRLPEEIRQVLTVASLLGYSFCVKMLFEVSGIVKIHAEKEKHEELVAMLAVAVDAGFIEQIHGSYQFTHDKLQKAFQDLVDNPTRQRLHQIIGERYMSQDSDVSVYNAAAHLNVAPGFLYCPQQAVVLAQINLDASRYCQQISAFDRALVLLGTGIELLDDIKMKWSAEVFELSLELTVSLARVSLLVGDFDTCNAAVKEAMLHVDTKEQKVRILLINVECRMAKNEMKASIRASTEALSELGVKLPRKATMRHVMFKFTKLKIVMAGKPDEYILQLPRVNNMSWALAIRLLMHIGFYSLLTDQEAPGVYSALLAMDLTLKHGLSTYAAPALTLFAVAVLRMGNITRAYTLGKLALKLMDRSPSREGDCPTLGFVHTMLLHWREPIYPMHDLLVAAATSGLGNGDVIYASYCFVQACGVAFVSGVHLEGVERSLQSQYGHLHDLGQKELLEWLRPYIQAVANFRISNTDQGQLSDFMHSTEYASETASDNMIVTTTTLGNKLRLANAFGFYDIARETLAKLESFGNVLQHVYVFYCMSWEAGVALYEGFIADGNPKHLRKARKYRKDLEQRDSLGPNAAAFLKHLNLKEVLLSRRKLRTGTGTDASRDDETLRLLDRELESFSLSESSCTPCFVVARAYMDVGSAAERMGRFGEALRYYERASDIYYQNWGAFALAAWVEEKCEALRRTQQQETAFDAQDLLVGGIVQFGEDVEAKPQECVGHLCE